MNAFCIEDTKARTTPKGRLIDDGARDAFALALAELMTCSRQQLDLNQADRKLSLDEFSLSGGFAARP